MGFLTPTEDIWKNTLSALAGGLERLLYLAGLRQTDGRYRHWGLARKYGEDISGQALGQAHKESVQQVLRQPLSASWSEAQRAALARSMDPETFAEENLVLEKLALPEISRTSSRHFAYWLRALSALGSSRPGKTPEGASPPRPPVPPPRSREDT